MKDRLRELQETLSTNIPIMKHLGITIENYDEERLILKAPFEENTNQKEYAFAGSLNALVTLAGWGLLWLLLQEGEMTAKMVIQESLISYLLPVTSDFSACCYKPDPVQMARFEKLLRKKGKARLALRAEIYQGEEVAVSFKGDYVAFLLQSTPRDRRGEGENEHR